MKILVVGNILKDIYLNLDGRSEQLETDRHGIKWLNLGFNASEHHFFHRESSLGGAAVSLEVLQKFGLDANISGSSLNFSTSAHSQDASTTSYRYVLIADEQVSYFAPSNFSNTTFVSPDQPVDYLYIDRSATINSKTAQQITDYLDSNPETKLIVYAQNSRNSALKQLLPLATLIFSEFSDAPHSDLFTHIESEKIIQLSETRLSYLGITEKISAKRIDTMTHLSLYSIAAATILSSFILGYSVETSLQLARLNVENSKLNASVDLSTLKNLISPTTNTNSLELIAKNLVMHPKGILAADESGGSIKKKFAQLNIPDTYENRRDYRNLFFTTPNLEKYVNGVILFDETTRQIADNGQNFVDYLTSKQIIPGIKVDQGLAKIADSTETYTKGLEGLPERLKQYYLQGLRFAKWRAAFTVSYDSFGKLQTPSDQAINKNCQILADYALACQNAGLVPIVEPELVYDGDYSLTASAEITGQILDALFDALLAAKVNLRACILKTNMILAGKQSQTKSSPTEVGAHTAEVLKRHVPAALAGVVFLSGGQTPEQATDNLAAIVKNGPFPWPVTFSFARALQDPALFAWNGDNHNNEKARQAFADRLIANTEIL